ncbi:MAG: glycosyltransferase [Parvularculaceae bacterium]
MFPAEALAQELKRRGRRVLLATDARGARFADGFPADARFEISAATTSLGGPAAKARAAVAIARGLATAMMQFRRRKVDAAVGFGGYPSLPAMKAAAFMRVPYGIHEQNSVLGRSNRALAGDAAFVAHAFPTLTRAPKSIRRRLEVGNPVRDAVAALAGAPFENPAGGEIRILVFGGSQGASLFSKVAPAAIASLPKALRARLNVVQQARDEDRDGVARVYAEAGVNVEIAPFFKDLPRRMARAHLVIARSGASSVTELATIGRPSILVPLGIAMDDHQTANAKTLADAGAATIVAEKDFNADALGAALSRLLSDPASLATMAARARGRVKADAARALADLVDELLAQARGRRAA